MPLTNKQYDTIMREYDRRQYQDYRLQCTRIDQIYEQIPRIREIDSEISACSLRQAERMIDQEPGAMKSLKDELTLHKAEKEGLLLSAGYPADYLKMHYTCPECKDTGYIGRKKCHCFLQQEIRLLYSSSHLDQILAEENFSHLSYDVYDEEQKQIMPEIIRTCHQFVNGFDQEFKNILFYGSVGTGKTFLSNCIAKELLDTGHSVIYFTSFQLFELLSIGAPADKWNLHQQYEALLDSDLLILDDCGTEVSNTFTVSRLFQLLNERALLRKSTIISTNLSIREFRDVYSERIFSRITSSYTLLKLTGSDIRIRRKINRTL